MAYTKLNIQAGNKLEATQLAHIESGIVANEVEIAKKLGWKRLWTASSTSSFGQGTIYPTNLSNYTLVAIITNNGTFFCSTQGGTGYSTMIHMTVDTEDHTLKVNFRHVQISGNNMWISYMYKENLQDNNGYDTENRTVLVPRYVYGVY